METLHILTLLALAALFLYGRRRRRSILPYPPGPKGWPLIGSFFERPTQGLGEPYTAFGKAFGEIAHYSVLGHHIIVVSSVKVATELFERRSSNYSDRPNAHMVLKLTKQDWSLPFMPYSDTWRLHRKTFHQYFNSRQAEQHTPAQLDATVTLLKSMLENPDALFTHVRHHTGTIILQVTYGYEAKAQDDAHVTHVNATVRKAVIAANFGTYLVDYLPWMARIPSWFPFTQFKRDAKEILDLFVGVRDVPFEEVQRALKAGEVKPSFVSTNLEKYKDSEPGRRDTMNEVTKNAAGVAFAAGADTTVSAALTSILAMLRYPDIMKQAHEELDATVGRGRLPTFDDRESLPLIRVIVLEALRWRPVLPINIPHSSIADDVYGDYFIPGGSLIFSNTVMILHDPSIYKDPEVFNPHRFMGENPELDPTLSGAFGFGRRICPGRYLAMNSLFIAVASLLWAFNFEKAQDESGQEVDIDENAYTDEFVSHPLPFKCKISPRFPEAPNIIRALQPMHTMS